MKYILLVLLFAQTSYAQMSFNPTTKKEGDTALDAESASVLAGKTAAGNLSYININDLGGTVIANFPGFSAANILSLSFGAAVTSPAWPAVKPLTYYVVPTGKTFRMLGMAYKTSAATTYVSVFQRKMLWKFAIATGNPTAPTLVAKTISGSGLTTLATYRYKIVGFNHVGSTIGSTETAVTLTGTQNAVTVSWTAVTGVTYYEVHRTDRKSVV